MVVGDVRKVFPEEIQKVQNLIEKCMSHYMNKSQVIDTLYQHLNIEPIFTKLVWEKLEEENQQFFEAYHLRLMVKDQIIQFNELLERQVALSHQLINPHGVVSNGSDHIPPLHDHNVSCYAPENNGDVAMKAENMQQAFPMVMHGGFNNCGPDMPLEMHHGPLNMALGQNMNGVSVTGTGYDHFANAGATLESHPPPVSSFGIMDSILHHHQFNGTFMDDTRSSQLLRQFSHDITQPDHFTNTTSTDTQRFSRSTYEPYFPGVIDIPTNNGVGNFGRDLYNNH